MLSKNFQLHRSTVALNKPKRKSANLSACSHAVRNSRSKGIDRSKSALVEANEQECPSKSLQDIRVYNPLTNFRACSLDKTHFVVQNRTMVLSQYTGTPFPIDTHRPIFKSSAKQTKK